MCGPLGIRGDHYGSHPFVADLSDQRRLPLWATTTLALWRWLSAEAHRPVLRLWVESYSRSLVDPDGPWGGFAEQTVNDWLTLLDRGNPGIRAEATLALAVLRGALLDLLATSDQTRTDRAITAFTESMAQP